MIDNDWIIIIISNEYFIEKKLIEVEFLNKIKLKFFDCSNFNI